MNCFLIVFFGSLLESFYISEHNNIDLIFKDVLAGILGKLYFDVFIILVCNNYIIYSIIISIA